MVGHVEYYVSAWIKECGPQTKTPGVKFMSLAFTPKAKKDDAYSAPAPGQVNPPPVHEGDIPF